ncbi:hypothetical protein N5D53_14450 [Pseudomonas sp. GD03862]|uniref:hypothetical protein n=1 Tax=Pseudomonas sp. GD03862 TaxID=2975391 RepID=UPI002449CE4D|nr:hypothetical protein [Pseudomonas sp. GD03862]MDH0707724.1 hypothetical protein [Pseudomonas sp. GD03862]
MIGESLAQLGDLQVDIAGAGLPEAITVAGAAVFPVWVFDIEASAAQASMSNPILRWATNWIICFSRSASPPFSTYSVNAMVGLAIVVSPVSVWSSQTQP